MDLPERPSTVSQLQDAVADIVSEFETFVGSIDIDMTIHISRKRRGCKIEIAVWSPETEYCKCDGIVCNERQHGPFPFRNILHRVQSDLTLEMFRDAIHLEKMYLRAFQKRPRDS
jgi:hypothetical protein